MWCNVYTALLKREAFSTIETSDLIFKFLVFADPQSLAKPIDIDVIAMELPPSYEEATKQPDAFDRIVGMGSRFCRQVSLCRWCFRECEVCSQVSRGAPVSVRNLVRQATVHLAGEDERTEQKTDFWINVILLTVLIILALALFLILILV